MATATENLTDVAKRLRSLGRPFFRDLLELADAVDEDNLLDGAAVRRYAELLEVMGAPHNYITELRSVAAQADEAQEPEEPEEPVDPEDP